MREEELKRTKKGGLGGSLGWWIEGGDTVVRPEVKLCDFGLAKRFEGSGTPEAVSCTPCGGSELLPAGGSVEDSVDDEGRKLDISSLGIVLHVLISGNEPFKGKSPSELLKIMKEPPAFAGKEWRGVDAQHGGGDVCLALVAPVYAKSG
eukprot:TRINITY_DN3299_c0_g2_i1.p1 TRINITY_DN3299_c0_g2~~TRINITY_DN3299_c0_g2_i1.p1  ORF type:complete len:149 (-),score=22.05 TRINITY_DN3299_c0_g2_i1:61-507(-)